MNEVVVKERVFEVIKKLINSHSLTVDDETLLIGNEGIFDSMGLVELCVNLEDLASELGFEFDWTSELALSRTKSIFISVGTLTSEFISQFRTRN